MSEMPKNSASLKKHKKLKHSEWLQMTVHNELYNKKCASFSDMMSVFEIKQVEFIEGACYFSAGQKGNKRREFLEAD